MTSDIDKLLHQIRTQQDNLPKVKGLGLPLDIAQSLSAPQGLDNPMKGLGGPFEFAKALATARPSENPLKGLLGGWTSMISSMDLTSVQQSQLLAHQVAIGGIANSLGPWLANEASAKKISASVLGGHLGLFGGLTALQGLYTNQDRNPFKTLGTTLQDVIEHFAEDLGEQTSEAEIGEFAEVVGAMGSALTDYAEAEDEISEKEVPEVGEHLTSVLVKKLPGIQSVRVKDFIRTSMHVITFALDIHAAVMLHKVYHAVSHREVLENSNTTVETRVHGAEETDTYKSPFSLFKTTTKVHLRQSATSKSESLEVLSEGQEVVAMWPSNGWLYVSYVDSTGEMKKGYVLEKCLAVSP